MDFWAGLESAATAIDDCISTIYNVVDVVYIYVAASVIVAFALLVMLGAVLRNQTAQKARIDQVFEMLAQRRDSKEVDDGHVSDQCNKRD